MSTLTFLGTSDSKGVPRWWCACPVCQEARGSGQNRRTRPAALVHGAGEALLLDCGPDLHGQLARLGAPVRPTAVLISHAHNDHLMGLGDLLDYAVYAGGDLGMPGVAGGALSPLPIYAPAEVRPQVEDRYRYAFRREAPVHVMPEGGLAVAGFMVRAFRVPHGANGFSFAFRFERPDFTWAYVTDAIDIPDDTVARWLDGLDLLVLGTSFADESASEHAGRSVYDIREALALRWAHRAGRVLLTHLSHGVDVTRVTLPAHFTFARDALTVPLE